MTIRRDVARRVVARRVLATVAALAIALASCGIPLDEEPQIIARGELPQSLQPGTSTTTTLADRLTEDVTIYLVDPGDGEVARLVSVTRQVPVVDSGAEVERAILEQLLAGPTSEEQLDNNLTTAIVPAGDAPISVLSLRRPAEDQLVVVLSETPAIEGSDRTVAFAQLVFTLTELNTVDQVRFAVRDENGVDEDISVSTDTEEGDVRRAVGRADFPSFSVTRGPG